MNTLTGVYTVMPYYKYTSMPSERDTAGSKY